MPDSFPSPGTVLMTADTVGGVWTYAVELVTGLTARGTQVILATMGGPLSADQRSEIAHLRGLRVIESSFKLEWMEDPWADVEAAGQWLLDLEHRFAPDIVHLNGFAHGALPWRAPVLVVGHSCVLSWWEAVRGEAAPEPWDVYREQVTRGLQNADLVVAPTHAMLGALRKHYGTLPSAEVIPNGRSTEIFRAALDKGPLVFAAGRLGDEAKNIATLGLAAEGLPWSVSVAGAESDASGCAPVSKNLHQCGRLSPAEVAHWMGKASIYCLPARYEPFGLSILEAALSGCALVLGDIESLRELWDGCAVFVPPSNPDAVRDALKELIAHPERRTALAAASKQRATEFTTTRFVEGYLELYGKLLARSQAVPSLAA